MSEGWGPPLKADEFLQWQTLAEKPLSRPSLDIRDDEYLDDPLPKDVDELIEELKAIAPIEKKTSYD